MWELRMDGGREGCEDSPHTWGFVGTEGYGGLRLGRCGEGGGGCVRGAEAEVGRGDPSNSGGGPGSFQGPRGPDPRRGRGARGRGGVSTPPMRRHVTPSPGLPPTGLRSGGRGYSVGRARPQPVGDRGTY